jgi:hypothetical protein
VTQETESPDTPGGVTVTIWVFRETYTAFTNKLVVDRARVQLGFKPSCDIDKIVCDLEVSPS